MVVDVINVENLSKRYGDHVALTGLDLRVAKGECVAVLGPNGAGKTTTIEILEGYRYRDSGDVRVLGVDPATASRSWRQRIGIVLQNVEDLCEAKVYESLDQFGRLYEHARKAADIISLVGLDGLENQLIGTLSGGQRRRLDVGLGIIGRPELLFLDEPTTGFDPEARREFWALIRRLKSEGTTIVLTTHYLDEADALADRVVVIAGGKKIADTVPSELGARHRSSALVRWRDHDVATEQSTENPTQLVRELTQRFSGEIPGLEVRRFSLEEAYLALINEAQS